jgi:hypothetical protein
MTANGAWKKSATSIQEGERGKPMKEMLPRGGRRLLGKEAVSTCRTTASLTTT